MWILAYFVGLLCARFLLVDSLQGAIGDGLLTTPGPAWVLGLQGLGLSLVAGLLVLGITAWKREQVLVLRYTGLPANPSLTRVLGSLAKDWKSNWLLILFLGGWLVQLLFLLSSVSPLMGYVDKGVTIRGTVSGEPIIRDKRISMTVRVQEWRTQGSSGPQGVLRWQPGRGELLVTASSEAENLQYGDLVQVSGLLTRPKGATVPGQFDYRNYLEHRGIYLQLKGESLKRVGEGSWFSLNRVSLAVRRRLAGTFTEFFPGQEGQVLCGLVLGSTESLDPELRETFNATGLGHLLSVSGFHVALVAGFFVLLGQKLGCTKGITYWGTISGVLVYSLISGLSPPVVRSAVMAGLGLYALLFNHRRHWPTALGLAALITTVTQPMVIFEPGYQLSFAATWAILALTKDLERGLKKIPRFPSWLVPIVAVPLSAQLGTWPLLAYHFNQFSPWSLVANLLLVEVAGLMLLLGLVMVVLAMISFQLAGLLQWGLGLLTRVFMESAGWLAGLPWGVISLPSPPLWSILCYYGLLWLAGSNQGRFLLRRCWQLWLFHRATYRLLVNTSVAVCLILLLMVIIGINRESGLQITFLDVGEGDSIFIRTPGGRNLLIDAGPVQTNREGRVTYNAGAKAVLPFLRSQGVSHLDLVVVSHLHQDHWGGLPEVVQHIKVDNLLIPPLTGGSPEEDKLKRLTLARHIKLLQGREGQRLNLDEAVELSIVGPPSDTVSTTTEAADEEQRLNNQSLVLQLAYGKHTYLFTGDIDSTGLENLLDSKRVGKLTLLKLPHHGSRYSFSSRFLKSTRPELGVISVGTNYYGHPGSEVLRYFRESSIPLFRTDERGAIHISDLGGVAEVTTFKSPER